MVGTAWAVEGGTHCTEREAAATAEIPSDERRAGEGRREGRGARETDRQGERGREQQEEEEGQEEMLTAS